MVLALVKSSSNDALPLRKLNPCAAACLASRGTAGNAFAAAVVICSILCALDSCLLLPSSAPRARLDCGGRQQAWRGPNQPAFRLPTVPWYSRFWGLGDHSHGEVNHILPLLLGASHGGNADQHVIALLFLLGRECGRALGCAQILQIARAAHGSSATVEGVLASRIARVI